MFLLDKISNIIYKLRRKADRKRLLNYNFTLISNDCWGAEVYKHFDLPFNTPFIGLMLMAPCYIELLKDLRYYLSQPLVFCHESRYDFINQVQKAHSHRFPIATLGNKVEIQFLHYYSEKEATEKWQRRIERINWSNLRVKFDGSKDFATPQLINKFNQLLYKKIVFTDKNITGISDTIVISNYTSNGMILFRRSLFHFDLVSWLN